MLQVARAFRRVKQVKEYCWRIPAVWVVSDRDIANSLGALDRLGKGGADGGSGMGTARKQARGLIARPVGSAGFAFGPIHPPGVRGGGRRGSRAWRLGDATEWLVDPGTVRGLRSRERIH